MRKNLGFLMAILTGGLILAEPAPAFDSRSYTVPVGLESLQRAKTPQPAPQVPFTDPSGAPVTLARFKGKTVVLNFWSTTTAPSVRELPSLNKLQETAAGRGVEVVTVAVEQNGPAPVKAFLARQELKRLKAFTDRGALARAMGVRGLPTTAIIDPQGREVARLEGAGQWDSPEALSLILQASPGSSKGL
ncbi:MAG: TlpA family protein disulfide reductase [Rhodospirillales bacterium]|nr:TlpA family protein disulfide reductase [Rhodospirillales bacterium]